MRVVNQQKKTVWQVQDEVSQRYGDWDEVDGEK